MKTANDLGYGSVKAMVRRLSSHQYLPLNVNRIFHLLLNSRIKHNKMPTWKISLIEWT